MAAKFVVYQDKAKKFRFRLLATNGDIIATGEVYENKASCLKGIKSIQKNAPVAVLVDETAAKEPAKKAIAKKPEAPKAVAKKPEVKKAAAKKPEAKK
jgi:uncharacterized protein YegP (UPF0339 family)